MNDQQHPYHKNPLFTSSWWNKLNRLRISVQRGHTGDRIQTTYEEIASIFWKRSSLLYFILTGYSKITSIFKAKQFAS